MCENYGVVILGLAGLSWAELGWARLGWAGLGSNYQRILCESSEWPKCGNRDFREKFLFVSPLFNYMTHVNCLVAAIKFYLLSRNFMDFL